jgi:hypothetical protein
MSTCSAIKPHMTGIEGAIDRKPKLTSEAPTFWHF